MVVAGPASSEYRKVMVDLLTTPKVFDVGKFHEYTVIWNFARRRLSKYGFQEPEPSQLFDILKKACSSLMEKTRSLISLSILLS